MRIALLTALALVLAACGGEDAAPGAGMSIADALATGSGEPVLVGGHLLASGGEIRLCSGFAESYPPQCASPSLLVEGVVPGDYPHQTESGVSWTDERVELLGVVEDGVLKVSDNAQG